MSNRLIDRIRSRSVLSHQRTASKEWRLLWIASANTACWSTAVPAGFPRTASTKSPCGCAKMTCTSSSPARISAAGADPWACASLATMRRWVARCPPTRARGTPGCRWTLAFRLCPTGPKDNDRCLSRGPSFWQPQAV